MADIIINPAVGKIDFFSVKGDNVTNTLKLTGNTLLVTGPLSASSISTGGGGAFVTSVQPTANYLSKFTGNSTIANSLIYDNATNIGIGTSSPLSRLHVSSTTSGTTLLRADGTSGTLFSVVDDLTDSLMSVNNSAGLPVFEVFADDRIVGGQYGKNDFVVVNNKVGIGTNNPIAELHVTSSTSVPSAAFLGGNVGVGTTSPIYPLDIPAASALTRVGSVLIGSWPTTTSLAMFGNSALDQTNAANYALLQSNQGITYLNAASGQSLRLRIANTDRLIIDSGGNVGIGTTSFVYGSANRGLVELYGSSDALLALRNSTGNLYIQKTSADVYINNTNSGIMSFATSNAQRMVIFSGGSVSFGSAADLLGSPGNIYLNGNTGNAAGPVLAFGQSDSVTGGIGHLARITGGGTSQDIFIQSQGASNSIGLNANPSGAAIYFQTQGAEKARITAAGNLGIGTSTPATKVDIYGPVSVRGTTVITTNFDLNAGNAADIYGNIRVLRGASLNDGMYIGYGGAGGNLKFFSNSGTTEFMTIATTGNVGIGSTSPAAKLDIVGTNSTIALSFGNTVPNNPLFINTYGSNTGIGMDQATAGLRLAGDYSGGTNPLVDVGYYSGGSVAHANWISRFKVVNSGATVFTANVYHSIGSQRLFAGSGGSFNYIYTGTTALNFLNGADTSTLMTLLNGGSVGIGTTSPAHKLEVYNSANSATYVRINNQNSGASAYTGVDLQSYGGGWQVRVPASTIFANSLQFSFNDAEKARITYDGNLGIGVTSPTSRLHISSSSAADEVILGTVGSDQIVGGRTGGSFGISTKSTSNGNLILTANSAMYLRTGGSNDRLFIKSDGNVGIGTTGPVGKFDVRPDSSWLQSEAFIVDTDGGNNPRIRLYRPDGATATTSYPIHIRNDSGNLNILTGNAAVLGSETVTSKFYFKSDGNLGIGTTSPSNKLHVSTGTPTSVTTPLASTAILIDSNGDQYLEFRTSGASSGYMQGSVYTDNGRNAFIGYKEYTGAVAGTYGEAIHLVYYDYSASDSNNGLYIGSSTTPASGVSNVHVFVKGNGNVGIGTTSPLTKFDVRSGYITTGTGTSTSGTIMMGGYYGDGNLTILGTEYSSGGPVLGYGITPSTTSAGAFLSSTSVNVYRSAYVQDGGTHRWYIGAVQTVAIGSAVSASERMRINADGNLGIGTSSPRQILHLNGSILLDGIQNGYEQGSTRAIGYGSNNGAVNTDGFSGMDIQSVNAPAPNGGNYSQNVRFWAHHYGTGTGNTPRMVIQYNGNVGIGSSSPAYKLDVNGTIGLSGRPFAYSSGNYTGIYEPAGNVAIYLGNASDTGNYYDNNTHYFRSRGGSTNYAIINSAGNLGIGTTTIPSPLTIYNNSDVWHFRLGGASGELRMGGQTNSGAVIQAYTPAGVVRDLYLQRDGGNVGIGTNSPATKLDVRGVIQGQSYAVADTGGTGGWVKLGTLTIPQNGYTCHIRAYIHAGFNALNTQDYYVDIFFKTSNASSVDTNGFAGNSWYYTTGYTLSDPNPKWVANAAGVSATAYDLYLSLSAYTNRSHYIVEIVEGATWVNVGSTGQTNPGNGSSTVCVSSVGFNLPLGNVGIGTTTTTAKLESYFSSNSLTFNYLATNLNVNSPIPVYGFDVTSGSETRSIKAGIGYERHLVNGRGTLHFYNDSVDDTANISGNRSSAGDIKMSIDNAGNVGIATTVPNFKFEIGAGSSNVVVAKLTQGYERVRYYGFDLLGYNDGNLWMIGNNATNGLILGSNWDWDAQAGIYYTPGTYGAAGGSLEIGQLTKNNANFTHGNTRFYTNGVERMRIISTGNVGIGTSSPGAPLTIYKASNPWMRINGGGAFSYIQMDDGTSYGYLFKNTTSDTSNGALAGAMYTYTDSGKAFQHIHSGVPLFTILSGGNVGIGTTVPSANLQVGTNSSGTASGDNSVIARIGGSSAAGRVYNLTLANTATATVNNDSSLSFIVAGNYSATGVISALLRNTSTAATDLVFTNYNNALFERMRIQFDGNVGIATTVPAYKLDVNGTFNASGTSTLAAVSITGTINSSVTEVIRVNNNNGYISFYNTAGNTRTGYLQGNTGSDMLLASENGAAIRFAVGGSEVSRISTTGNVGIGTTVTSYKLTVNGDLAFNGGLSTRMLVSYTNLTDNEDWQNSPISIRERDQVGNTQSADKYGPNINFHWANRVSYSLWVNANGILNWGDYSASGIPAADGIFRLASLQASANIGIGTTSPAALLNIRASAPTGATSAIAGTNLQIDSNASSYISFINTADNGTYAGLVFTDNNNGGYIVFRNYTGDVATGSDSLIYGTYQDHIFQTGTTSGVNSRNEVMRIKNSGYVGINTNNPTGRLHIVQGNSGGVAAILLSTDESTIQGPSANTQIRMGSNLVLNASNVMPFNVNASETMRIINNGNIGIGTTTPLGKLHVYGLLRVGGAANEQTGIIALGNDANAVGTYGDNGMFRGGIGTLGSANYTNISSYQGIVFNVQNAAFGSQATRMLIDVNGNVGIGTTGPVFKLDVNGTSGFRDTMAFGPSIGLISWGSMGGGTGFGIRGESGRALSLGSNGNWDYLVINTSGNVGIGTTSPLAKLQVNSTTAGATLLRADGTSGTLFSVTDDLNDSLMSVNNSAGLPVLEVFADDRIVAGQYGRNDFVVINNKVGVGTNNPTSQLEVGNVNTSGTGITVSARYDQSEAYIRFRSGHPNNSNVWETANISATDGGNYNGTLSFRTAVASQSSPSVKMTILPAGNVGIGTTTPSTRLHIYENANRVTYIAQNNLHTARFEAYGTATAIDTTASNGIFFRINGGDIVKFAYDGNVGIGTSSPTALLHVNGGSILGTSGPTLSFNGNTCTAASYNYVMGASNDGGNKLVIFVNGSARTDDGGVNALTIRNDGGPFVLGQASYLTSILGSSVTINSNVALHAGNYTSYAVGLTTNNTITGINTQYNETNTFVNNVTNGNRALTLYQPTAGADAYMTFHVGSDFAGYFGLGGAENDLVWGGWSVGTVRYRILHSGNASYAWNMNQNVRTSDTCSFAAVTATTFTGALAGNATTATNLSTNRTNWSTNGTITAVVGQLSWKNYGNGHTIIDASNATSPAGGAINNTNPDVAWTGTYPTLMGWNGSNTYGVRVDSSRYADNVSYAPSRTDSTAYPVLWGAGTSWTIAYSCAAVTIQSSTGTLTATTFSGAGTGLTGTAASLNVGGTAGSISGFNNPATAATASTIAYRDSNADLTTRYFLANRTSAGASQCGIQLQTGGTTKWWMYLRQSDDNVLAFYTSNATADDIVRMTSTGLGIKVDPSNRLHINGDNTNPAIRVDNGAVAVTSSSAGASLYGWLPISIAGTTRWIQLWNR